MQKKAKLTEGIPLMQMNAKSIKKHAKNPNNLLSTSRPTYNETKADRKMAVCIHMRVIRSR